MVDWQRPMKAITVGKGRKICDGEELAILSIGAIGNEVVKATSQLNNDGFYPAHYDLRFVKPLDEAMLHEVFTKYSKVITVEDGCLEGGAGSAVLEFMADNKYSAEVIRLGIPDAVIEHGEQPELWAECGFDAASIVRTVKNMGVKQNQHIIAS
jgi:1-deoxy-D-xylulose-5-phosphate synthase